LVSPWANRIAPISSSTVRSSSVRYQNCFDLFANDVSAKFGKRFAGLNAVLEQSPLPQAIRDLVLLRASQLNGCSFCTNMHSKDAAARGRNPGPPRPGRGVARGHGVHRGRTRGAGPDRKRPPASPTARASPTKPGRRPASATTTTSWRPWSA